ncbi:RNA polymerase [Nakamurella sp. YIM 132087]|uniref:RNA polymerase n=1 Tax=Nakamurella alba TaxID=2665158 RepID=A0A7K1FSE1_9ACTN|nr:DUF6596 domain-containing protein [Nakamurella alba]MTD15754.1 RNA polymerase [Nakamurella alba]
MPADQGPAAPGTTHQALTAAVREDGGRLIALLTARFGDLHLADEAFQDAVITAAERWPADGVPGRPVAWLHTVAAHRAIDLLRRAAAARRRWAAAAPDLYDSDTDDFAAGEVVPVQIEDHRETGDERLRLMLLCAHPALAADVQVALTLRLVGGLSTEEIAAAFLVPTATMAQRIVRAKKKIRDARIPLVVPADPTERIGALLDVLYLICNEGYLSRGDGAVTRVSLTDEAIRLTALLRDQLDPDTATAAGALAEVEGLLALQLFLQARSATRVSGDELVLLDDQDRTRWDLPMIDRARRVLAAALHRRSPGPFQLQALIAEQHAIARTAADTDWPAIATFYRHLARVRPGPVVTLNHAVAVAMADGPRAGLALLDGIRELDDYHLFHAVHGELLLRDGRTDDARAALRTALDLARNPAEVRHLRRRISDCG